VDLLDLADTQRSRDNDLRSIDESGGDEIVESDSRALIIRLTLPRVYAFNRGSLLVPLPCILRNGFIATAKIESSS